MDKNCTAIVITSDKCYDNVEWIWGYREHDRLGGPDPYSASKGSAELAINSYIKSYFNENSNITICSARAGNVIGGGDWSEDRIIPDCVKAWSQNQKVILRNPHSTRPWQHVLEPLSGYLMLAERLYTEGMSFSEGWNFGPTDEDARPVRWLVERMAEMREDVSWECDETPQPHEANYLKLDSSKAHLRLGWQPRWRLQTALQKTLTWHEAWQRKQDMRAVTLAQMTEYQSTGREGNDVAL